MSKLYEITPFTLLDYPNEMACIAWFAGCNMRCVFCHNPPIVLGQGEKDDSELIDFLKKRAGQLTAVVFSGGEATLNPSLPDLARQAKELGYKVKLDTNGTRPEVLAGLLEDKLLDYVAMDYKCPPDRAQEIVGTAKHEDNIRRSMKMMIEAAEKGLIFEIRTTYHADLMSENELSWMINELDGIGYKGTYYIQNIASHGEDTLGKIEKPSTQLAPENLPQPRNFKLSFRNFPAA